MTWFKASFNQALADWNMSIVGDVSFMFWGATAFNQDLLRWDMSRATTAKSMFQDAVSFDQNLSAWNVSGIFDFTNMFSGATSFNQNPCAWGQALNGSAALVDGIFANTACVMKDVAVDLFASPPGPFCVDCSSLG